MFINILVYKYAFDIRVSHNNIMQMWDSYLLAQNVFLMYFIIVYVRFYFAILWVRPYMRACVCHLTPIYNHNGQSLENLESILQCDAFLGQQTSIVCTHAQAHTQMLAYAMVIFLHSWLHLCCSCVFHYVYFISFYFICMSLAYLEKSIHI